MVPIALIGVGILFGVIDNDRDEWSKALVFFACCVAAVAFTVGHFV